MIRGGRRRWQILANFGKLLMTQDQTWWGEDVSGSENGASRYLGFPRGRKELDSGTPLDRSSIHPSPDCAGLGLRTVRGERADHESSAGLLLDNSAHSLVALSGCDVSTCCTQRISKDNDAPRVTHRPLNQPDPVRICIEVPTIGSVVARTRSGPGRRAVELCTKFCHET